MARKLGICGFASFDDLKDDPLMIVRAGGAEAAAAYLDKAKEYYGTEEMGSWHRFDDIEPGSSHNAGCRTCSTALAAPATKMTT